jgi:recombinational DNA repair ATPase RecF
MGETALAPRCAALVGTYLSGKTTLLESLLMLSAGHPDQLRVRASGTIAKAKE